MMKRAGLPLASFKFEVPFGNVVSTVLAFWDRFPTGRAVARVLKGSILTRFVVEEGVGGGKGDGGSSFNFFNSREDL